jgi:hypothetical protein
VSASQQPSAEPDRGPEMVLPLATDPDWEKIGPAFAVMLLSWREWIHRRVDRIRFEDQVVARRMVSVDFTVPDVEAPLQSAEGDLLLVPLTRLRKRTLTNFDLVDENGRSLPLLTRQQDMLLALETLKSVVTLARGGSLSPDLLMLCSDIAGRDSRTAQQSLAHLAAYDWGAADHVPRLARVLAESALVTVPLKAEYGRRRILKFSYDELVGDPGLPLRETLARGSAFRSKTVWFPVYAMSDVPTYHLEIEAPAGLWFTKRELLTNDETRSKPTPGGPYTRVHFYHEPTPVTLGMATVALRPQTSTMIRASSMTAWFAFALLFGFFVALWWGGFRQSDSNAPALLLFLPSALSAILLRPADHPMTTDMLYFIRFSTAIPGVLSFVGGAAFAGLPHNSAALPWIFAGLSWLAYVAAFRLTMSWRLCAFPPDPDRAQTRAAHTFDWT